MENGFQIADLIVALIQGEISEEELTRLDKWLDKSEDNKALFLSFMDEAVFADEKKPYDQEKMEMIFAGIRKRKQQIRNRKHIRVWSTVAAAGIAVIFAVTFWLKPVEKAPELVSGTTISIGKRMAYLVLANGEKIALPNNQKDTITAQESHKQIILNLGRVKIEGEVSDTLEAVEEYHLMEVPRGAEYNLILPDGTKVWLNADSKLRFPEHFNDLRRYVELSGEAYFEVTRDEMRPFIVHTDNINVKVLGTEFCIRNYKDRPTLATLVRGSVEVTDQGGWQTVLEPGLQTVTTKGTTTVRKVEPIYYTAWKDGYFIFEDTPLEDIMAELSLWYNCQYFFVNPGTADIRITARLKKYDEIDVLLRILSKTNEIQIDKKGNAILIRKK